jgi:hypothetical protein
MWLWVIGLGLGVISGFSSAADGHASCLSGRLIFQGDADVVLVDSAGRVDSVTDNGGVAAGIPGCERYEEPQVLKEDPDPLTSFALTGVPTGLYRIWVRPRVRGGVYALSWSLEREAGTPCMRQWPLSLPRPGCWYQLQVRFVPPHDRGECGAVVGPPRIVRRPVSWNQPVELSHRSSKVEAKRPR